MISGIGTVVEEVTATDADSGVNAELVYRIQKGAFDDFAINETTGVVTVSRKLDYDEKNTYHVEVIAFDKGKVIAVLYLLYFFFFVILHIKW